jgi:hypothetical protein
LPKLHRGIIYSNLCSILIAHRVEYSRIHFMTTTKFYVEDKNIRTSVWNLLKSAQEGEVPTKSSLSVNLPALPLLYHVEVCNKVGVDRGGMIQRTMPHVQKAMAAACCPHAFL